MISSFFIYSIAFGSTVSTGIGNGMLVIVSYFGCGGM